MLKSIIKNWWRKYLPNMFSATKGANGVGNEAMG